MFFRRARAGSGMSLAFGLVMGVAALTGPSAAQSVEVSGLGPIDPWGSGFLAGSEGALSSDLWTGSIAPDLVALMGRIGTGGPERPGLTPTERSLLRRVVLSAGTRPSGEAVTPSGADALMAERIRLIRVLGEDEAALSLMRASGDPALANDARRLGIDRDLAAGREAAACAQAGSAAGTEGFDLKARAVCFALADDAEGAELSLELAASAGVNDAWLSAAVLQALVPNPKKPPVARLNSGLNAAASLAGELKLPVNGMDAVPAGLAMTLAERADLPSDWRVQAALAVIESGTGDAGRIRRVLAPLISDPAFVAGTPLAQALVAAENPELTPAEKAARYSEALKAAGTGPDRFLGVASQLAQPISALPRSEEVQPQALLFARAALVRRDIGEAGRWIGLARATSTTETAPDFDSALLTALVHVAADQRNSLALADALTTLGEQADTPARREAAARVMAMISALGKPLGPQARSFLAANLKADGQTLEPGEVLRLAALTSADTRAELFLRVVRLSGGQIDRLTVRDSAALVSALRAAGQETEARALALEALKVWAVAPPPAPPKPKGRARP